MAEIRYWIVVASEEHVRLGVAGGFVQAGHGKRSGIARMQAGDQIVYYSPKVTYGGSEPLRAFTAVGEVAGGEIVQVEMSPDFKPFRRSVVYRHAGRVPIAPLLPELSFIRNKRSWGAVFRFGLIRIPQQDFERIEREFAGDG